MLKDKDEMIKKLKKYKIKNHINKKCKLVSDESSDSSCDSMSSSEMVITNLKCNRNHNLTEKGPIYYMMMIVRNMSVIYVK